MHQVCILTDISAQFTQQRFKGDHLVHKIPLPKPAELQPTGVVQQSAIRNHPELEASTIEMVSRLFSELHKENAEILVITLSYALSDLFTTISEAIRSYGDMGHIQVIDSHTTSIGLGLLVQKATGLAVDGLDMHEIEQRLRISIPTIYTMLCLPNLSYLAAADFLSPAQAVVGEMLELLPIFSLENDCLTAIQKVRTLRHLMETFQEFIEEFEKPDYIAVIKNGNHWRTSALREYISQHFPGTSYGEHNLGVPLTELLGPQSIGLIVMDKQD